jgi:hypothetical protein
MKIFRFLLVVAFVWGLINSCSNEIDLYPDDAPEMLYVLGCADVTTGNLQVKVRKMITGNLDAYQMINDPDYYLPNSSVKVSIGGYPIGEVVLNRVMYPPQTGGSFAQDSNLIYETSGLLFFSGQKYALRIEDSITGSTLTSSIPAVSRARFSYPTKESVVNGRFRFTDSQRPFYISYTPAPASIWTISLKYVDFMKNGEMICRKANYHSPKQYGQHAVISQSFSLEYLWRIFGLAIPDDDSVDLRKFYRFDFTVWLGDEFLSDYMDVADRFADNRKQFMNNIEGGMGLFFSVSHERIQNVYPLEPFNVALANADTIRHLKFVRYPYDGPYTDPDSTLVNPFFSR